MYVCFPETKNTHTHCRCRTSETWGAGICAGMCSAAAGGTQTCCLPWSIVPALLQPHTNHPAVTTGLLALTPADLPHSFPNGTKRSNNFPSLEKIPLVPYPLRSGKNQGWCYKGCLGWADLSGHVTWCERHDGYFYCLRWMWQEGILQKLISQQQVLVHEPRKGLRAHLARCCECPHWGGQGWDMSQCCCFLLRGSPGLLICFWTE